MKSLTIPQMADHRVEFEVGKGPVENQKPGDLAAKGFVPGVLEASRSCPMAMREGFALWFIGTCGEEIEGVLVQTD